MAAKRTARGGAQPLAWLTRMRRYFEEAYAEMQRVTWPTREVVVRGTVVVVAVVVFLSLYIFVLDQIFVFLSQPFFR